MKPLFIAILFSVSIAGCVLHLGPGSYRNPDANPGSIFGDIRVSSGQEVQNIQSVNGSIELSHRATAMEVETVNGNVEIGDWVRVAQVVTVNGNIRAGENLKVDNKVETINGNIHIAKNAKIRGSLQSVNGHMTLNSARVEGLVFNMNGDISLQGDCKIIGDLIYKPNNSENPAHYHPTSSHNKPVLSIAKGVVIEGNIILKRPVKLRFEDPGLTKQVIHNYETKK